MKITDKKDGCKAIIVTIFVKYEEHRSDINDRILDYYRTVDRTYFAKRKIAESKDKESNYIHLINQLILEMCQSLSNRILLNEQKELRRIQLMNTPHRNRNKSMTNFNHFKREKEISQDNKYELFHRSIIRPIEDIRKFLTEIIQGIVNIAISKNSKQEDKLKMFYHDLENVWDLTVWPIAEYALWHTLTLFDHILSVTMNDKKKEKKYNAVRPFFIAGLSSICATARQAQIIGNQIQIKVTKKTDLSESKLSASDPCADGEIRDCKCGNNRKFIDFSTDIFAIDCDDCHSWSHGKCVGYPTREDMPDHWICSGCELNREIEQQLLQINAKHGDEIISNELDQSTKLHILLINYLSKQLPTWMYAESSYGSLLAHHTLSARQFHLIQWLYWKYDADKRIREQMNHNTNNNNKEMEKEEKDVESEKLNDSDDSDEEPIIKNGKGRKTRQSKKKQKSKAKGKKKGRKKKKKSDKEEMDEDSDIEMSDANKQDKKKENKSNNNIDKNVDKLIMRLFEDYFIMPQPSQRKTLPTLSDAGIHRVNMQLALQRKLIKIHSQYILALCNDLRHNQTKSRVKALKSLKEICDIDSSILKEQDIKKQVILKFTDSKAQVREAAIDLVGNYVIHDSSLIEEYFDTFKRRINDISVSVRKRVIRIFKEICLKAPQNSKYQDICSQLFRKMSETNESIQKLIAQTFEGMWFSDSSILQDRIETISGGGGTNTYRPEFKKLVQQIINGIQECSKNNEEIGENLIDLIVKMLEKEEKKSKSAQQKSNLAKTRVYGICDDMCCVMIDKLAKYDFRSKNEKQWERIKPLINALYIFCQVRPAFLSKHFATLQSYITDTPKTGKIQPNDPKQEQKMKRAQTAFLDSINVMTKLAQIITTIIPFVDKSIIVKSSFIQLQKKMLHNLWNSRCDGIQFNDVIQTGFHFDTIQCLCSVVTNLSMKYDVITDKLLTMCMGILYAAKHNKNWNPIKSKPTPLWIVKALIFLGTTIKYFDVENHCKDYQFKQYKDPNDENNKHCVLRKIYEMYLYFCDVNSQYAPYAIQGFIPLFCRDPSLMNNKETIKVINSFLPSIVSGDDLIKKAPIQTMCLQSLHEFFLTEERRTEYFQNESEKNTNKIIKKKNKNNNNNNKNHYESDDDDDIESDSSSLSDEGDIKDDTGRNQDVAGIRGASAHKSDTGNLITFSNAILPKVIALCSSKSQEVRYRCAQLLSDWNASGSTNPIESLKEVISLCFDPENGKTRDISLITFDTVVTNNPYFFNYKLKDGIKQTFILFHKRMNASFIDYVSTANSSSPKNQSITDYNNHIIERIMAENTVKLFQVLDELLSKPKQREYTSQACKAIMNCMDFDTCCKKEKIIENKNYVQIPIFIKYLCHFLSFIPFEIYKPSHPFAVIKELDNSFKQMIELKKEINETIKDTKEKIDIICTKNINDKDEIKKSEKEILKNYRKLYEYSCHALMCLVIYQFRDFWAKLWKLKDETISVYKLTVTKKNQQKDFKAKRQTNGDFPMFFEFEIKNKGSIISKMRSLHQRIFIDNKVKKCPTPKQKRRSTRHQQINGHDNEMMNLYEIPPILTQIIEQFIDTANQYSADIGADSTSDSELTSTDDDDDDDINDIHMINVENINHNGMNHNGYNNGNHNNKNKPKKNRNNKKKQTKKKKKGGKKKKKKKKFTPRDSEEENESNIIIKYADSSSDDNNNNDDDSDDSDF